jgi:hypothetical protein
MIMNKPEISERFDVEDTMSARTFKFVTGVTKCVRMEAALSGYFI